ncbi:MULTISPECIES: ATP-binding protein [Thermococcus]|uniref:DEXX-box atpase n=1 Tax=Thermococcus sibiricus (strain DSM 12597 / MM 739) TaxID=604354 RepID=C6A328_THESM|nr:MULTISPECIES: ATP-binding protein [Thermococcus]ACS90023.1 DEXX-box atpase [Thermococcus sibiricus MM 739]KUK29371.1 MAG: DEXX-box atpase [Thermococcus sp. 40_45]MBC7095576.1 ATP-binding protein [Thermococcus sp.]HII66709.1 ATP-binding protein [Thermococcaceae archaeon]
MFINRKAELKLLADRVKSNKAEFVVLYGRRRIGKTALILELIRRYGGIYLLARETSETENLRRFSDRLANYFNDDILRKNPFQSWDAFFEYLHQKSKERIIVAIDEFPYLVKGNKALPSILQEYWDLKLSKSKIFLIICGSSVSMMEKLLGYKSPIYGRRTAQLKLKPMDFFNAREFLPKYSPENFLRAYGVLGGSPAYLLEFDGKKSIEENLLNYFRSDSFLYQDAPFILREELDEPRNYFAIMEAIAKGKTSLGEIMSETGLNRAIVGKYLSVLIDLDLVRREVPVTASWKSRKGKYYINDPYFAFWFRYVQPNIDLIEMEQGNALVKLVMEDIDQYLGVVFEEVTKQFLARLNKMDKLPLSFTKIGRWWYKGEEIDLVALNERERQALLVEVKWKDVSEGEARKILKELTKKAQLLDLKNWQEDYGLVGRSIEKKDKLRSEGWFVWDLEDFEALIRT